MQPGADQRFGFQPLGVGVADQAGGETQEMPRVLRPAVDEVLPQAMAGLGCQRREFGKFGVGLVVARQERDLGAGVAAGARDLVDAVRPVAAPAQKPHHDKLGLGDDRLDVEIDRHVVAELHQVGETERRETGAQAGARVSQHGELGIGGRQHDDVAGRLAEIDRLGPVGDGAGLGGEKMHQGSWASTRAMASRSRPVSPMTTSSVRRISPGRQGRS